MDKETWYIYDSVKQYIKDLGLGEGLDDDLKIARDIRKLYYEYVPEDMRRDEETFRLQIIHNPKTSAELFVVSVPPEWEHGYELDNMKIILQEVHEDTGFNFIIIANDFKVEELGKFIMEELGKIPSHQKLDTFKMMESLYRCVQEAKVREDMEARLRTTDGT